MIPGNTLQTYLNVHNISFSLTFMSPIDIIPSIQPKNFHNHGYMFNKSNKVYVYMYVLSLFICTSTSISFTSVGSAHATMLVLVLHNAYIYMYFSICPPPTHIHTHMHTHTRTHSCMRAHSSYMTLLGVHKMHGRVHPN